MAGNFNFKATSTQYFHSVEEAFQIALKVEEKLARRQ
jgi:hypothetical protein